MTKGWQVCIACSNGTFMRGNMKNFGQSLTKWKLFLWMNRISQCFDAAYLTDAESENIPDVKPFQRNRRFKFIDVAYLTVN